MDDILTTDQLVCGYDTPLLGPLDLAIPAGAFVLIEGPNGIGKSTFLETIAGLMPPLSGSYRWTVKASRRRFVPQVRTLDPLLPATVEDVVATGAHRGAGLQGFRPDVDHDEICRLLERVDMGEYRTHLFRDLSEGQKQLVLLARALMDEARAMLLDEPAAAMDPTREQLAVDILREEHRKRGLTLFVIAHGSRSTREAADTVFSIDRDHDVDLQSA
jgi:ABC-type Mn2+/Zn2+ transport system ATPase subunit